MYFNTLEYYAFFLITALVLRYAGRPAAVLLVASLLFYVVAGWFDTLLIAGLVAVNWLLLRFITGGRARIALAVAVNVGVLIAVKYRVFLAGNLGAEQVTYIDTVLPLGISFYTFQLLAYQVDAVKEPDLREPKARPFALFVMFFPQLIAGPIVRARQLLPQIQRLFSGDRRPLRLFSYGLALCALGLGKKVLFADSLAPIVDDIFFIGPETMTEAWTGAWLFTFQIYFDFSGYSDIAIGCAYLLGIRLPLNFRTPYISLSPREFWQRWHITLSTWIRDYLYIPLGGSRGSQARQLAVLLLVMGIAGLWHGANTTFIVWGLLWGIYIGGHRLIASRIEYSPGALRILDSAIVKAVLWGGHITVIVCLWVFFRAQNAGAALDYLGVMFSAPARLSDHAFLVFVGCAALMAVHFLEARGLNPVSPYAIRKWNRPLVWGFLGGICLWLVMLPSYTQNPFIYFRF